MNFGLDSGMRRFVRFRSWLFWSPSKNNCT